MTPRRIGLAIAAGLTLSVFPFLRYSHFGHSTLPHADHAPRHGGQLRMVGDHHIELLRRRGRVEAFVSDAKRRPVSVSRGWISFGSGERIRLTWDGHRLSAPDDPQPGAVEIAAILEDGTHLAMRFNSAVSPGP